MEKVEYQIIKKITTVEGKDKFYRVNRDLIKEFFLNDKDILEADIYVHRIFANIIISLTSNQFHDSNKDYQMKLKLFEEEFHTKENSAIQFTMNVKDICKKRNHDRVEKALKFLEQYKYDWYTSINSKGQKIRTLGGVVSNAIINKNSGNFTFTVNAYWLEKILNLVEYNETYYNLVQNLSSDKHILFWYWLICLPEEGTEIKYTTLNERFNVNYKSARNVCNDFLKPIKINLDKYSHKSFNYSYTGDKIQIAKYQRTILDFSEENKVSNEKKESLERLYKISYIIKRHNLNEENIVVQLKQMFKMEKELMNSAYHLFIASCKKRKIKATDFSNQDFINEFQLAIKETYKKTNSANFYPNAYPKFL